MSSYSVPVPSVTAYSFEGPWSCRPSTIVWIQNFPVPLFRKPSWTVLDMVFFLPSRLCSILESFFCRCRFGTGFFLLRSHYLGQTKYNGRLEDDRVSHQVVWVVLRSSFTLPCFEYLRYLHLEDHGYYFPFFILHLDLCVSHLQVVVCEN